MNKYYWIILLLILSSCAQKENVTYKIIDIKSTDQQPVAIGDIIGNNKLKINLGSQDVLVLASMESETIYSLRGPQQIDVLDINKSEIEKLNVKYFSFIKENLDKNPQELKNIIIGEAANGPKINMAILDSECIFFDHIDTKATSVSNQNCSITMSINEEIISDIDNQKVDLSAYRLKSRDQEIVYTVDCGHEGSRELIINLISTDKKREIENSIAFIKSKNYPSIALTSFYFENKLYQLAKEEIKLSNSSSKFINQLDHILND